METVSAKTGDRAGSLKLLIGLLLLSFLARASFRLWFSDPSRYWQSGYSFYHRMAVQLLETGRLTYAPEPSDWPCYRTPIYPAFVAAISWLTNDSAVVFIVCQALISTLTVALVYWITRRLAGETAALWSAALYAFFPYSVVHDTQLQENVLYNALSLLSVGLFLTGLERQSVLRWMFVTGLAAGAAVLTRASHLAPAVVLPIVVWLLPARPRAERVRASLAVVVGMAVVVVPWMIRNAAVSGRFALTSQSGVSFGLAHNPQTFDFYPYRGTIDQSWGAYHEKMSPEQLQQVEALGADEFKRSAWYQEEGWRYIRSEPVETIRRGFVKALVSFAGVMSPLADPVKNWVYSISFWGLTILALVGLRSLRRTPFWNVFWGMMLAQAVFSFVYYAHTSHRSYLDPLLAVPAGIGMARILRRNAEQEATSS